MTARPMPAFPRPVGLNDLMTRSRPTRSGPRRAVSRLSRPRSRGGACPKCRRPVMPCPDGASCTLGGFLHARDDEGPGGAGHACPNGSGVTTASDLFDPHSGANTGNVPGGRR